MRIKIACRPRYNPWLKKYLNTKTFSKILAFGILLNSIPINSFAGILSDDGRYETFEGDSIKIDNVLEEDKVDVEIEGNTMVNVANQKDPIPITKSYKVEGTNHIPLQGEYDGKARPVIEGSTMYYNNDTGEYSDTFIEGANLSLVSSFEDQLVTQEMIDSGLEKQENLGKYKVEIKTTGKNKLNPEWLPEILKTNSTKYGVSIKIKDNKIIQSGVATETYTELGINIIDYLIDGVKYVRENRISLGLQIVNHDNTFTYPLNEPFTVDKSTMKEIRLYYQIEKGKNYSYEHKIPQLEEGSIITEYEPYKESIKTFYLNSPLLEGDTIEEIDEEIYHVHRYKEIVLDGSDDEGWIYRGEISSDIQPNMKWFNFQLDDYSKENINNKFISNNLHFYGYFKESKSMQNIKGNCFGVNNKDTEYKLFSIKYECLNKTEFLSYLNNNPLTVVYPLETYNYELLYSLDNLEIDSYANGHLDLNTNIPVNKVDFIPTATNLNYLYPSTEYVVQFESDNEGKIDTTLLGNEVLYSNYTVKDGINRFNITTPSIISSNKLILDGIGFNLSELVVTQFRESEFEYFEGVKSVGQDDINGHSIEVISSSLDENSSNKVKVELKEPLRGLSNEVKDRIIKRNGKWMIERNCTEIILDSKKQWYYHDYSNDNYIFVYTGNSSYDNRKERTNIISNIFGTYHGYAEELRKENYEYLWIGNQHKEASWVYIDRERLLPYGVSKESSRNDWIIAYKEWLSENKVSVIYQLETPIYEPLDINPTINTYLDTTHISTNSTIPANLKVTVDRVANRAKEYNELAKENPTIENISLARMWTNKMRESILKDEFQDNIDNITEITDMILERKTASANLDVYIKSENMLSMNLSTNSITFDDFSGIEDMTKENAVNISINSSLPYNLNAYLATEIQNSDKSNTMNKDILSIKDNSEVNYQTFSSANNKVVLKSNCSSGNDKQHDINLKLNGGIAHEKDVYKTTIKFEAEQQ